MTDSYGSFEKLKKMMAAVGARRLIAKRLAENDNSKNQIYLGSDFEALNIFPFGEIYEDSSEKNKILKASLNFSWLLPDGARIPAHGAQLILYPQYPEVRMSGILKGTKGPFSCLIRDRLAGRVIFFGIEDNGRINAAVVSPYDSVAREVEPLIRGETEKIFHEFPLALKATDTRSQLLREFRRIYELGWIDSKRLTRDRSIVPCAAPHCGGYTLEAELGITPNGYSEPDYLGWEIKQHTLPNFDQPTKGRPITLLTPEPTGGLYKTKGVSFFLKKYGYPDQRGCKDRLNFGGIFKVGKPVRGLVLTLEGYDMVGGKFDASKGVTLVDSAGTPAAIWNYTSLLKHWARKHERAAYVPSEKRTKPRWQYRYGKSVLLAEQTDFLTFLRSMAMGKIYYDPAIKIENASSLQPKTKRRSQFRVHLEDVPSLYKKAARVDISKFG